MRLLKWLIVVGIAVSFGSIKASAQAKWVLIGESRKPASILVYMDTSSITFYGDSVAVWIQFQYKHPKTDRITKKKYVQVVERFSVKCEAKQFRMHRILLYSSDGNVVRSGESYDGWEDAIPDTHSETIVKMACSYANGNRDFP